jgi:tRNA dimethylallyltransferase
MSNDSKPKIIAVIGPTASGKSDLAVEIALFINKNSKKIGVSGAEIISADSRQVYKWMNIGSNKITKKEMRGVKHHLLSVTSPKSTFTVARYQKLADKAIKEITKSDRVPIICGGSGQYIDAILFGHQFPNVKPNPALRAKLEKISTDKLFLLLQKKDPTKAKIIDRFNKRRLVRALEIIIATKKPILPLETNLKFNSLIIGIYADRAVLKERIQKRVLTRLKLGMIKEVKNLHTKHGLSWKQLESFGLEYRFIAQFLEEKITENEMIQKIVSEGTKYTKRQMTWFKRNKDITWINSKQKALRLAESFLK